MNRITLWSLLNVLLIVTLLLTAAQGTPIRELAGWPLGPQPAGGLALRPWGWRRWVWWTRYRQQLARTWPVALLRSLALLGLWQGSGQVGPAWIAGLPWVLWLLPEVGPRWQGLKGKVWQYQQAVLVIYLGLAGWQALRWLATGWTGLSVGLGVGVGCAVCGSEGPQVRVECDPDGGYQATLCGHFTLQIAGDHPFRLRLLAIFLGLLQSPDDQRPSRRTRDGRTPFVRQEQLATWFGRPQEVISRWQQYWLDGNWANLLSLKTPLVLTAERVARIVTVCATFPDWSAAQVYAYLRQQGLPVSQAQVEQAVQQSGWQQLQATLRERFDTSASLSAGLAAGLRLRDAWLVGQLLGQVQALLEKVETGLGLTPEERWTLDDVQTLATHAGAAVPSPSPTQPWLQTLEAVLLGAEAAAPAAAIRCPYCGTTEVGPKSRRPRWKKYYDARGQVQRVAVYRYYCHNPQCAKRSFTHLPPGLVPYSPYRTQVRLLALQMYAWGYSTYRRTGTALGVGSMTAYRWVRAWGQDLLPIAALFGVVKSSGVVGIDEKYVLVPKNDKPAGKMRRWMYVYLAVDVWTYDLLHIALYPNNDQASAHAFLLALRAKGYHPSVVVTDLRDDYGPLIAQVFPAAVHHECIFHALQNVQRYIKEVYGAHYADEHPEAVYLKTKIYAIFDTRSPEEAHQRYARVLELKTEYIAATPAAATIFDFLERHWPQLVNGIGSATIPTTNNTVELVIRRFDQHYQNFGGFESQDSAQGYLAVFEKLYRFTPFSPDAQPRIRGKSPLQLAGYDVAQLPMTALCSGLSIDWPTEVQPVPN